MLTITGQMVPQGTPGGKKRNYFHVELRKFGFFDRDLVQNKTSGKSFQRFKFAS